MNKFIIIFLLIVFSSCSNQTQIQDDEKYIMISAITKINQIDSVKVNEEIKISFEYIINNSCGKLYSINKIENYCNIEIEVNSIYPKNYMCMDEIRYFSDSLILNFTKLGTYIFKYKSYPRQDLFDTLVVY